MLAIPGSDPRGCARYRSGLRAPSASRCSSCQLHDVEPWAYLRDWLLDAQAHRMLELASLNWKLDAVERQLADNPYGAVTLAE